MRRAWIGLTLLAVGGCAKDQATDPYAADRLVGTWTGSTNFVGTVTLHIESDGPAGMTGYGEAFAGGKHYPFTIVRGTHDLDAHRLDLTMQLVGVAVGPTALRCNLLGIPATGCSGTLTWTYSLTNTFNPTRAEGMTFSRVGTP